MAKNTYTGFHTEGYPKWFIMENPIKNWWFGDAPGLWKPAVLVSTLRQGAAGPWVDTRTFDTIPRPSHLPSLTNRGSKLVKIWVWTLELTPKSGESTWWWTTHESFRWVSSPWLFQWDKRGQCPLITRVNYPLTKWDEPPCREHLQDMKDRFDAKTNMRSSRRGRVVYDKRRCEPMGQSNLPGSVASCIWWRLYGTRAWTISVSCTAWRSVASCARSTRTVPQEQCPTARGYRHPAVLEQSDATPRIHWCVLFWHKRSRRAKVLLYHGWQFSVALPQPLCDWWKEEDGLKFHWHIAYVDAFPIKRGICIPHTSEPWPSSSWDLATFPPLKSVYLSDPSYK